jgi:hypothetical protein
MAIQVGYGYFTLTLDTTGPNVEVYVPPYADRENLNEITFVSNEPFSSYQDIYFIDSLGTRHDFTFILDEVSNEYIGHVVFSDYPMGIGMMYGQFQDDVGNLSNIVSKPINIISSHDALVLKLTMSEEEASISVSDKERNPFMDSKEAVVIISSDESTTTLK